MRYLAILSLIITLGACTYEIDKSCVVVIIDQAEPSADVDDCEVD